MPLGFWLGAVPKGFTLVNLAKAPLLLFQHRASPPPPLLGFQGLDWTDFGGEIGKSGMAKVSRSGEPQALGGVAMAENTGPLSPSSH